MDANVLLDRLVDSFLAEAEDDLVGLWEIVRETADRSRNEAAVREDTLAIVRELLSHGLQAGDPPYTELGYRPWADQAPDAVIDRIRQEWVALGHLPDIPDIVWFARSDSQSE